MKVLKALLPMLLIFSLLLCSCADSGVGNIGGEENPGETEAPEETPGGEEKPEETPGGGEGSESDNNSQEKEEEKEEEEEKVEIIRKPLEENTIVNFGDSIFGTQSGTGTEVSAYLQRYSNATVYNCGYGGCRMASYLKADGSINEPWDAFSMYRLADAIVSGDFSYQENSFSFNERNFRDYFRTHLNTLKSLDFNKVDIITISYGTNDFTSTKNSAMAPADNPKDVNTLEGALRYSIEKIKEAYPHIEIYVCTPIYRTWYDKNNNYSILGDATNYKNSQGYVLTDYVKIIKDVVAEYDYVSLIDSYNLGFNASNRLKFFSKTDGTHPNEEGRRLLAEFIYKRLQEDHP